MTDVSTEERKKDRWPEKRQTEADRKKKEQEKESETGRKKERKYKRSFSLRKKDRKKGMKTDRTKKTSRQKEKLKKERQTKRMKERKNEIFQRPSWIRKIYSPLPSAVAVVSWFMRNNQALALATRITITTRVTFILQL